MSDPVGPNDRTMLSRAHRSLQEQIDCFPTLCHEDVVGNLHAIGRAAAAAASNEQMLLGLNFLCAVGDESRSDDQEHPEFRTEARKVIIRRLVPVLKPARPALGRQIRISEWNEIVIRFFAKDPKHAPEAGRDRTELENYLAACLNYDLPLPSMIELGRVAIYTKLWTFLSKHQLTLAAAELYRLLLPQARFDRYNPIPHDQRLDQVGPVRSRLLVSPETLNREHSSGYPMAQEELADRYHDLQCVAVVCGRMLNHDSVHEGYWDAASRTLLELMAVSLVGSSAELLRRLKFQESGIVL